MNFDNIKNQFLNIINSNQTNRAKVCATISLGWMIFIGYLTWWNGYSWSVYKV